MKNDYVVKSIKFLCDNFLLKPLKSIGVSKDMIGRIRFHLSVWSGIFSPYINRDMNERTTEYLWLLRNLPLHKKAIVLDVGCSGSLLSYELIHRGYNVYGIDSRQNPDAPDKLKFYEQDAANLPFEDNFFDTITAVSTLEHIGLGAFSDPCYENGDIKVMKELKRVLKKGGYALITVPFANTYTVTYQRLYDKYRLLKLSEGLSIEKETFYMKKGAGWSEADFEEVKKIPLNSKVNIIDCLILRKAFD